MTARAANQDHGGFVGQESLELRSFLGPSQHGEGITMLLACSPSSLPQQLSPAPVPAEWLVPLTYISLVGCSISIMASLLTILWHFQVR